MAKNSAVVVRVANGNQPSLSQENIAIPSPEANQVLVKVSHVAQNPTDGASFPCRYP
jgi:NADPH:quinone reductase-like Zn-dependent oxidoreductase